MMEGLLWILLSVIIASVHGSRLKTPALPIQPEREPMISKGLSGCSFGGRFYSLEDTWHPDLGEPFGVMHCVMCHCEPQRSRRGKVFGKVSCRNMKQDCPDPTCDDPVLLPGHCCKTCPKGDSGRKEVESLFDFFQEKDDDLHKSYNDRSYISSEDTSTRDSTTTDFVALLTGVTDSWLPSSSGVARARFTLSRTSLTFSITFQRINRPSLIAFLDTDGNTAFEFRVPQADNDMICGIWKNVPKPHMRQLEAEQLHVSMTTADNRKEELQGRIIKHRALFAETFSAILTSDEVHSGMGGIAMLTLSDTENNLHFILIMQGLVPPGSSKVPVRVKLQYRQHLLREIRANITADDSDFAEVLADLNSRELFWLSRGQLQISVQTEGQTLRHISGFISGRRSCDTLQSVLSSGAALTAGQTGGVGSAVFTLHPNGSLDYQLLVAGLSSAVLSVSIEMKPRRRNKRSVLYELSAVFTDQRAAGSCGRVEARHTHMLLQNELFINIATALQPDGELRGQIRLLPYNGLDARRNELPVPLAGVLVSPPVRTGAAGHAWVSVDPQCHLHYEIIVNGLSKSEDASISAHLHGLAEIGEMDDSSTNHKRLLTGFYGQQAQGVLKDISVELLRHLNEGTAYLQVSTKMNPRGEIRGRIHVPNHCESPAPRAEFLEEPEFEDLLFTREPTELRKDTHTHVHSCFFEGEQHTHGSQWTPQYNTCFTCTCQKKTVICDPVMCPTLSCTHTVQPEDQCCPICEEKKESKETAAVEKVEENPEGCYFEGDQKMHAPGTTWHPFVPPFGYIKCAVCTCKGSTGEVHCEKVTCPPLTCSRPIRRNPSDCCKECPPEETPPLEDEEMMQADGTRLCKFGKNYYQNSEHWHPSVPLVGEMKCITCWCDHGVTKCQRKQCPLLSCRNPIRTEGKCCPECIEDFMEKEEMAKMAEKKKSWRH
uniref:Chordin n=1 Tax=Danio rerio TaxID=7955 RepID=CHRD_DANRE|nr:RecName: Full=Chordin; AltName: Full=Protein chordino; Flags: Precursor [Danio rerio]AAB93485.1 chordin [Danio rerio]